jgi:hypothetical protein
VRHTASDQSNESKQEKRGLRLSHLSWIVIAAAAVAGELTIQFSHNGQMEQFAAPVVNVPAFHVLKLAPRTCGRFGGACHRYQQTRSGARAQPFGT